MKRVFCDELERGRGMIRPIDAEELERFIRKKKEKEYVVIDVRRAEEYRLDHIPGAVNMPLSEILFDPFGFEADKQLIFYCRRGSRSKVAAILASEAGYDENLMFHLTGGIEAYKGEILLEVPRIDLFPEGMDPVRTLKTALELEKGAFFFYTGLKEKFRGSELYKIWAKMADAEVTHARAIFKQMMIKDPLETSFAEYFEACEGNILEGGKSLADIETYFSGASKGGCIDIVDFAIDLEFSALDLYKTMALNASEADMADTFFSLAEAEKKHLEQMIQAGDLCDELR